MTLKNNITRKLLVLNLLVFFIPLIVQLVSQMYFFEKCYKAMMMKNAKHAVAALEKRISEHNDQATNDYLQVEITNGTALAVLNDKMSSIGGIRLNDSSDNSAWQAAAVNDNGNMLFMKQIMKDEINRYISTGRIMDTNGSITVLDSITGGDYVTNLTYFPEERIYIIATLALTSYSSILVNISRFVMVTSAIEVALLILMAVFYSRSLTHPIMRLNVIAQKIARQDFSQHAAVRSKDEIGQLGISINAMSCALEQNLSDLKQANDQLSKDIHFQKELKRREKVLISNIVHEIKTPLTTIIGYIQGVRSGIYSNRESTQLDIALKETYHANQLIMEMLEIARMENPQFVLEKAFFDLGSAFIEELSKYKETASEKAVCIHCDDFQEAVIYADERMIKRVVDNLISNAIFYTPPGSNVYVHISSTSQHCEFSIENESATISKEEIPQLWEPFYRSKMAKLNNPNGSGLGLYIIKEILDVHGFSYNAAITEKGVCVGFLCPKEVAHGRSS